MAMLQIRWISTLVNMFDCKSMPNQSLYIENIIPNLPNIFWWYSWKNQSHLDWSPQILADMGGSHCPGTSYVDSGAGQVQSWALQSSFPSKPWLNSRAFRKIWAIIQNFVLKLPQFVLPRICDSEGKWSFQTH